MKKKTILNCGLAALLLTGLGLALPQNPAPSPVTETASVAIVRIGVFDSRGIALAYGRSARPDCLMAKVAQLKEPHEQAKKADNKGRLKELEGQAVAMQDAIHKQVFSGAPIPEILALIKADLPGIAREADVAIIVGEVLYESPGVELVDITLEMCAPFQPDAATLKMIKDLIKQPVVPESELSTDH